MESLIFVNVTTRTARSSVTGVSQPRVICTLLAQWQARFRFFITGEEPAAVPGISLRCVLKATPTGAALIASSVAVLSGVTYSFDFSSVDSAPLRALLGDLDNIDLTGEIELTIADRVERVAFPVTVINSRHRPEDVEPPPYETEIEDYLTARAVRYDDVSQVLTNEQKAAVQSKLGISSGVSDHGALSGLADDDHPQYLDQTRGDARYPLALAMTTALAGKEPLQTLATEAEMQAGVEISPRRMSPALIAAAIEALAAGGPGLDLPLSLTNGGTGSTDADAARLALAVEFFIAAVAQQVSITVQAEASTDWNNNGYIDIADTTGALRLWFNVDSTGFAPEGGEGLRLAEVSLASGATIATVAYAIAAALSADGAFSVAGDHENGHIDLTVILPGLVGFTTTSSNYSIAQANVTQTGANSYRRLGAFDGRAVSNVDALTLQGYAANAFAAFSHVHAFTAIQNRPLYANMAADIVSTSTNLVNLLSAAVVSGKTYSFFATGTLSTSVTTEGCSLAINGPAASGIVAVATLPTNGIGGLTSGAVTAWEAKFTNINGPGSLARGRWEISGRFVASAAGSFAIRGCAETVGNSVTFHAGSILVLTPTN